MLGLVMMLVGAVLLYSGCDERYRLPAEHRGTIGVGRLSTGIVLMSVPVALAGLWWLFENTIGRLATV